MERPPVCLHVTIKVRSGRLEPFCALMADLRQALAPHGWCLVGAWGSTVGRVGEVVNVWRLPSADAVRAGFAALAQHPDWPRLEAAIAECVEDEVLKLMDALPYAA
jgi:hypothetical protein